MRVAEPTRVMSRLPVAAPELFKSLSDPTRWAILQMVSGVAELPFSRLAEALDVGRPTISHHTRSLAEAGLIDVVRRGRTTSYSLRRSGMQALQDALSSVVRPRGAAPVASEAARLDEADLLTW
jgi:DNA-binding transcriptional ArsR family regulator